MDLDGQNVFARSERVLPVATGMMSELAAACAAAASAASNAATESGSGSTTSGDCPSSTAAGRVGFQAIRSPDTAIS